MTFTSTYTCCCGRELSFYSIAGHLKSKIHKELLEAKLKKEPNETDKYILLKREIINK